MKTFLPTLVFIFVSVCLEFFQSFFCKRFTKDPGYFPFSSFFPFFRPISFRKVQLATEWAYCTCIGTVI